MSTTAPTDCLPHPLCRFEPEVIEARLGRLMRRYLLRRSAATARRVVRHLEALCLHPDALDRPERRCTYRRLAGQWRWLARQDGAAGTPAPAGHRA